MVLFLSFFLCGCMVLLTIWFGRTIQTNSWNTTAQAIVEKTQQSSRLLHQRMQSELDALEDLASSIPSEEERLLVVLDQYKQRHHFTEVVVIGKDGNGIFDNGTQATIIGIEPYQYALQGISRIMGPFTAKNGLRKLTLQVPIIRGGQVVGGLYANCDTENYYDDYALDFFDGKGFSAVIDHHGEFIFTPKQVEFEENNIFDLLLEQQNTKESIETIRQALENDQQDIQATLTYEGKKTFFCLEPVGNLSEWYSLSIIPQHIMKQEANHIIGRTLMLCVFMLCSVMLVAFLFYRNMKWDQQQILQLAYADVLTGASNFTKFKMDAANLLQNNPNKKYAILYSDIKNFKYINDVYGFEAGDNVLKHYIQCFQKDGHKLFYARVGGDTFVSIITYNDQKDVMDHCERLYPQLCDISQVVPGAADLIIYTGIYCTEGNNLLLSIDEMIDRANIAQKKAKRSVITNFEIFTGAIRDDMLEEQNMENHMKTALQNGEFLVYLQPKYDTVDECIHGAEALVRWRDPAKGLISPGKFIPLFERNGFICQLDTYMFRQICQLVRCWIDKGLKPLPISVNVSKIQIKREEFLSEYIAIKNQYQIPDGLLEIEFTESVFFDNKQRIQEVLRVLHENGFRCSIDDFGSGYSSMNLLKDLPVDVLKLDKVFFDKGDNVRRGRIIVESMIAMAKKLSMQTVAEGVEEREQVQFLRAIGCDMIQGYVFARPMPVEEFESTYIF